MSQPWPNPPQLPGPPRSAPSPLVMSLLSLASAVHDRLQPAGWRHERLDAETERWTEPGARREVRVDELRGDPRGRVVEATNGHELIVIRCVGDTQPDQVIRTLDLWQMLPPRALGGAA